MLNKEIIKKLTESNLKNNNQIHSFSDKKMTVSNSQY